MHFPQLAIQVSALILCLQTAIQAAPAAIGDGAALMAKAEALLEEGAREQALNLFEQAKAAFEIERDQEGIAESLLRIGYTHLSLRNIPAALESYQQAAGLARKAGLKEAYRKAADAMATTYFLTGRLKEALPLLDENIAMAKAEKDRKHYSTLLVQLGHTYFQLGMLDTARVLLNEALAIKNEIEDVNGQALALNYLGLFYYRLGDYERTLDYYLQSIRKKEALGDSAGVAILLKNVSNVFIDLEDPEKAGEYAQRSYDQASQLGLRSYTAEALSNLALLRLQKGEWREALANYQEIAGIYRSSQNGQRVAEYLLRIGHIYLDQGMLEQAEAQFREAEGLAAEAGSQDNLLDVQLAFGQLLLRQGHLRPAITRLEDALEIARANHFRPKLEAAYRLLAQAHKSAGDYRQSLEYHEAYAALRDSLNSEKQIQRVQEMETRFRVADKEKQINLLHAQNELQGLRLEQSHRRLFFLAILLLAGLGGGFLALYAYRTKQRANQELAEKNAAISKALQEKELLLREIHHRVKNNLQVISGLLKLQSAHLEDPNALAALAEGRSRVQSMALIHQNLYQEDNLTGIYAADYVPKLIETLFHSYNIRPGRIELSTQIASLRLDVDTAVPLGLILNELISNALKHAFPEGRTGCLEVMLKEENGQLQVRVQDDGAGMPEPALRNHQSFGFQLIEMLAEKMKAQLSIITGSGTAVLLSIQNYKLV